MVPDSILIATTNEGKIREVADALALIPVGLAFPKDLRLVLCVKEDGESFQENSSIKAISYAIASKLWSLADDSGLEVDALGGRPGIFSARYGGASASDSDRISLLLDELKDVPDERRSARFVCAVSLASPEGRIAFSALGVCEGRIGRSPCGDHGFGYDPIFIPQGFNESFGELPEAVKRDISHRARALKKFSVFLSPPVS
jgi:XTP/dITP diphosphohydrolase